MGIPNGKPDLKKQGKQMLTSDVDQANFYIEAIGGGGKVNATIYGALKKLREIFPHKEDPRKQWTERRLRAWWNRETDIVRHWQMLELHEAAERTKNEKALLDEARREHAKFIERSARIATFLERSDPDFFGPEIQRLGRQNRQLDRSRADRD